MPYEPKNYERLLGTAGFSDQLLKNHFTLYGGYVTNANKLSETLANYAKEGKGGTPEYAEMKRRFGWEFDGMRLHELYFENMVKDGSLPGSKSDLFQKIEKDFGSFEMWEKDFRATGAMRGIGWAILYFDAEADRLFNVWINEHDTGHFAGCKPLLVMDVFEHAFMLDYGTKRADYIEAFFKAIDWEVVEKRV
ncbi:MAG: Fe-Mn family superoxide dismutase [Patescibacteria group bacterium]|jgi:Fe-Mn family superoxide dismutase